jgi:dTDP-4-amino-4,6-dideoxygalactose transaminase
MSESIQIPKWPVAGEREKELLNKVLESGQWGGFNELVKEFESRFAGFQHCRYGVSAFNGTVTLETALTVLNIGPGDEVIVPAISFISTATAVSRTGATPVFVDIEPDTFNLDPERTKAAISPRTRAILVVHFGGPMANMDAFLDLSREHGLILLEDAAHAHGSEWSGKRAGSLGLAGSFSFQNGKVMTAGEGGLLTTNDSDFAVATTAFINQGRKQGEGFFFHFTLGSNFRLTGLQAAILLAQFERLPEQILRRRKADLFLRASLAEVPGLRFQRIPAEACVHSHYLLLGRIDAAEFGQSRDEFHQALSQAGIPCTPFYPHTLYQNPLYQQAPCRVEPCPVAESCIRDAFWLPHRVLMADEPTLGRIAEVMQSSRV